MSQLEEQIPANSEVVNPVDCTGPRNDTNLLDAPIEEQFRGEIENLGTRKQDVEEFTSVGVEPGQRLL